MEENKNNTEPQNQKDNGDGMIFRDEKTRLKMEKHMSDMNDEITEEDIANVKTDVTPNTVAKSYDDEERVDERREVDNAKTDNVEDTGSPWTILNR